MSSSAAEKKIKKLARLPSNTVCANCGTSKKFGFSTVCIKYFTFVCNNCKSSHQAISHRCKSLTMSSWSDEEVAELERKGNDYARRTWLKHAPPVGQGGRPKEGDSIDVFKRFVVDVYERKRYYGEDEGSNGTASSHHARVGTATSSSRVDAVRAPVATRAPVRKAVPAPAPPPSAPLVDLLDFSSVSLATPPSEATNNGNSSKVLETNFDAFAPVTSATASKPSTDAPRSKTDSFKSFNTQTVAAPKGLSNTFEASFDAFAPVASVTTSKHSTGAKTAATQSKTDAFDSLNSQTVATSKGPFEANFDAFAPVVSEPSRSSNSVKSATVNTEHDPFQPAVKQTLAPSNNSSFDFMNGNNAIAALQPAQPPVKKAIMNNPGLNQKSSLISSMSMSSPNNIMHQGSYNMKMGWNTNNNQNYVGGMGQMQSPRNQTMMQQQQMNMMNGMHMNSNGMGGGMMNSNNMMMMMGGMSNPMMMNQQQTMMNGNSFGRMMGNTNGKSNNEMQSLQLNSSSMSAWSSSLNK